MGLLPIEHLAEAPSTNDVARGRAVAGAEHGWAVRADVQTAGRGQRGHSWTSPAGGLYLSVVLRPGVPQHLMPGLPVACGIGACRALAQLGVDDVRIKWPNDLVVGESHGLKLAGMLIEAGWAAGGVYAVCGIGVNVETPKVERPTPHALEPVGLVDALPDGVACPSLDELATRVRDAIVAEVDAWSAGVAAAGSSALPLTGLMDAFYDLLAYRGEYVALIDRDGNPYSAGTFTGLDAWGRACIRHDDGEERAYDPAQVSVRPLL